MKVVLLLFAAILLGTTFSAAQDQTAIRKKHYNLNGGVGIQGYDPVAYFAQGKAVKGNDRNAVIHQGVVYYFASASNKEEFKKNAPKYEPQYGGWCAYAMGESGDKVNVDPKTFKILHGKLYLFYNKLFNNTLNDWNKDEVNLNKKADANWQKAFR